MLQGKKVSFHKVLQLHSQNKFSDLQSPGKGSLFEEEGEEAVSPEFTEIFSINRAFSFLWTVV